MCVCDVMVPIATVEISAPLLDSLRVPIKELGKNKGIFINESPQRLPPSKNIASNALSLVDSVVQGTLGIVRDSKEHFIVLAKCDKYHTQAYPLECCVCLVSDAMFSKTFQKGISSERRTFPQSCREGK